MNLSDTMLRFPAGMTNGMLNFQIHVSGILVIDVSNLRFPFKIQARIFYAVLWYYIRIPPDDIQNVEIFIYSKN